MKNSVNKPNILITLAALSVMTFSIIGIGVMTGFILNSFAKDLTQPTHLALTETTQTNATPKSTEASKPAEIAPKQQMAEQTPTPTKKTTSHKSKVSKKTAETQPELVAAKEPEAVKQAAPICADCGMVESIRVIEEKGKGTGLGAVLGGVAGALLGNQVGRGNRRKIATVAGAAGGAYAGQEIEKNARSTQRYEIDVRMEDGSVHTVSEDHDSGFKPGDKVKIVNGGLVRN